MPRYRPQGAARPGAPDLSRRRFLQAAGLTGLSVGVPSALSSCAIAPAVEAENGASAVTGSFDWRAAEGTTLRLLQTPHPYQKSFQPLLAEFTELTGIELEVDLVPEADYYTKLNIELAGATGAHDVFMLGAYFIWQYGPPGWLEDLGPWIENSAATNAEYDFEDIFQGLRDATKWDFQLGSPIGQGGQWALPWGFENNVVAYNKAYFDRRGIKPADDFENFIQLAVDLTDRSENRYGVAFRGSKSWATIHPGFMTQYSREGAVDYELVDGELQARMNSPEAVDFVRKWVDLAHRAGPVGWTTYTYPDCTNDLGDGTAMMVYDADSATYPKNQPGASAEAGNLGWHPGPAGPDGNYDTNLWTWCLAMNSVSSNKLAAWLFMQWATGKEAMTSAVQQGAFADPVRQSVFDGAFKQTLGGFPGYLESFETVIDSSTIQFTPQSKFFDTTEDWAVAVQDIFGGADAQERLDSLARTNTSKVNL
ncbi:carbohydrate ABC transporter substrate-binding protein (CUT1 family) [Haloactinopolyspora alba]|uniref:Carbohydrate ABC transporter substrate-binding protein (CUT1 family) n=1 Tax=Haloactinopolyspora alba TaxID=648780 RepID=A0A2P8E5L0_9ACTN|nr:extracellular solute-binding protein [Haloactinopolyspora alba]PSL04752.1 carbohydrate ABC transporter substrate-binding protein (CUT1 family) [Haloactinopolyspora alba]